MDGWSELKQRETREWAESLASNPGTEGRLASALLEALAALDRATAYIDKLESAVHDDYHRHQSRCC